MSIEIIENKEDSTLIKRKKTFVAKKYSPTRSKSIEDANELAVYLFAMNRFDEALVMLKSYSEMSPFVEPRYERWEASCFAMLLQAHIEKLHGNIGENQRLINKVCSDLFNPSHWVEGFSFEEFLASIEEGINNLDGATKNEKLKVRAEGFLLLINAYYSWCNKWSHFSDREMEIEKAMVNELNKISEVVS